MFDFMHVITLFVSSAKTLIKLCLVVYKIKKMVRPLWSLALLLFILFLDTEEEIMQELCAFQMNVVTSQIVDVHHARMVHHNHEDWAYDHIQGLSLPFLRLSV